MATFYINGAEVTVAKKQKLLRYLRDELHLTSVKDGCRIPSGSTASTS